MKLENVERAGKLAVELKNLKLMQERLSYRTKEVLPEINFQAKRAYPGDAPEFLSHKLSDQTARLLLAAEEGRVSRELKELGVEIV